MDIKPDTLYRALKEINQRPEPYEFYTALELWNDPYTSEQMLSYHLNPDVDMSSRRLEFIERSVNWMISEFGLNEGMCVADFGCGPGLYANRLSKSGADVTGIDFSVRSIEYAKEQAEKDGLRIDYVNQNYLEFETDKRFDLIIMIMCDFCALSPDQRRQLLTKFKGLLKPGGSVLLDAYSLKAYADREESAIYELNQLNNFWSADDYYGFVNTFKYDDVKVVLDKYTIVEADRIRTIYNWLQYFSIEAITKEFESCGLTIDRKYANVAGDEYDPDSGEFAVVGLYTLP